MQRFWCFIIIIAIIGLFLVCLTRNVTRFRLNTVKIRVPWVLVARGLTKGHGRSIGPQGEDGLDARSARGSRVDVQLVKLLVGREADHIARNDLHLQTRLWEFEVAALAQHENRRVYMACTG
jgi:hypothetical protein